MRVCGARMFRTGMRVQVDMSVTRAVVFMGMRVNLKSERDPSAPQADTDQDQSDEAFTEGGERFEGNQFPKPQHEHSNGDDSGRMSEPPARAGAPRAPRIMDRQRRNGREVIWSGKHVQHSRREP